MIGAGIVTAMYISMNSNNISIPTSGVFNDININVSETVSNYNNITSLTQLEPYIEDIEDKTENVPSITIESITEVNNATMRTYESYKLFNHSSNQYMLQQIAYTDDNGLRYIVYNDERYYCVAVGSAVSENIGQLGYLEDVNGNILNIVVSDVKDDKHTDNDNIITVHSNCASEFVVDIDLLNRDWKRDGSIGIIGDVVKIGMYDVDVE